MTSPKLPASIVVRISWTQRLELTPALRDIRNWPEPNLLDLDKAKSKVYHDRRNAIAGFLSGRCAEEQARRLGCCVRELYRLLERCLGSTAEGEPALSEGLIPERRVVPKSGPFLDLQQQYPDIFKQLESSLEAIVRKKHGTARYGDHDFWSLFMGMLITAKVSAESYPFNTLGRARESLRKWRRAMELEILAKRVPSRAYEYALLSDHQIGLMDCFQLDGHLHDFEVSVLFDMGDGLLPVRVARFWIILVVEEKSTAVLGYSWGFSQNVRTDDILECLDRATSIWTPSESLPPGLSYLPGAGFPSMFTTFRHAVPYLLKLDNAWAHSANDVRNHLHSAWGCVVNWGRARFPVARRVVEMVNLRLATFEHQFPSTTGNNPFDARRDQRRDLAPAVPLSHLPALIDVCIATINSQPRADLMNASPLDVLQRGAANGLIVRKLLHRHQSPGHAFRVRRKVAITGNPGRGKPLHVNFAYEPYKGTVLHELVARGVKRIVVEFDRRDIRTLTVIDFSGRPLGTVSVGGQWAAFPHDERLRQAVNRQAAANKWSHFDALVPYFTELAKRVRHPSDARRLVDLNFRTRGTGLPSPAPDALEPRDPQNPPPSKAPIQWKPTFKPKDK